MNIRDVDALCETLKWPIALVVLGAMFLGPIRQLLSEPVARSAPPPLTAPVRTSAVHFLTAISAADPAAAQDPDLVAYRLDMALEAQRVLLGLPAARRHIVLRMASNSSHPGLGELLRAVGFQIVGAGKPSEKVVILPRSRRDILIYKNATQFSRGVPIVTTSDPTDAALRLALLIDSSLPK